ncbi:Transposon TX1 uncharacterized 149 kDa protein [Linum grandiflorum]
MRTRAIAEEEKRLLEELEQRWNDEELFWKQRASTRWLKEGDRNTAFFHTSANCRRQQNYIARLKDMDGNWIVNEKKLRDCAHQYFVDIFTRRAPSQPTDGLENFPQCVTQEMNDTLCRDITSEDVRTAVFALGADKAPGPDGFSGEFYRSFWNTIGEEFCSEVKDFFHTSVMPPGWNDTHLALITKIPNPTAMTNYRPISCCNFKYKVISKIMTQQLKRWIPILVSEMQAAFTGVESFKITLSLSMKFSTSSKSGRKVYAGI